MSQTLTIAIPTFNRARHLDRLLASVAAELAKRGDGRVHVLVSDNCSTDGTPEIVAKHQPALPNLTYLRNETNVGMQANFWQCITRCTTDYLWMIGDDEVVEPGCFDLLLGHIDATGLPLYVTNYAHEEVQGLAQSEVYGRPIHTAPCLARDFFMAFGWLWALGNLGMVVCRTADVQKVNPSPHDRHSFMQAGIYLEAFATQPMQFINAAPFRTFVESQSANKERNKHDGTYANWPRILDSLNDTIAKGLLPAQLPITFFNGCSAVSYPIWNYFLEPMGQRLAAGDLAIPEDHWLVARALMEKVDNQAQRAKLVNALETLRQSVAMTRVGLENSIRLTQLFRYIFNGG